MAGGYILPEISESNLTPIFVRSELLRCLENTYSNLLDIMNLDLEEAVIKDRVLRFVTMIFQDCDVSFDQPTKEGLFRTIEECKKRAELMMGPVGREVIDSLSQQMVKLVEKIPD
ncbi:MAG: hypothetical protein IH932_04405 [Thaumarchaeota archaeon]|nr:hypothetical protein [Nitrososphaerota archaeon]